MATGGEPVFGKLPDDIWQDEALALRFRLEKELGIGGQAVVVVAHHLELDERVALKFLLPEVAQSSAAVARFRREARAAAKIKNEHVVRIIDVCSTRLGIPYIVMEYLPGCDLEHVLQSARNRRLAVPDAVDFVLQASEALAEGHRLGIVHRDLKPANLFCVDRDDGFPMIKVLDFGISKIKPLVGDVERTDRYEILGSPRYMSPEQIDASRDVDQRSDIWSLGVILYQALAGRVPFGGEIVPDLWHKIRTDTPRSLAELRKDVPAVLNPVVMKCLEKERARRYANLGELAEALACVAPERSRGSIARILRTARMRPTVEITSISATTTNPTLVACQTPRVFARRRRAVVFGLSLGATALAGLAAARLVATRFEAPQESRPPGSTSQSAATASTTTILQKSPNPPNSPAYGGGAASSPVPSNKPDSARGKTPVQQATRSVLVKPAASDPAVAPQPVPAETTSSSTPVSDSSGQASGGSAPIAPQASTAVPAPNASSPSIWIVEPVNERKKHHDPAN